MRINIEIGVTKYRARNKRKDIYTVVDILKTYNSKGELVKTRYVAECDFMGQKLTDYDQTDTGIQLAIAQNGKVEL